MALNLLEDVFNEVEVLHLGNAQLNQHKLVPSRLLARAPLRHLCNSHRAVCLADFRAGFGDVLQHPINSVVLVHYEQETLGLHVGVAPADRGVAAVGLELRRQVLAVREHGRAQTQVLIVLLGHNRAGQPRSEAADHAGHTGLEPHSSGEEDPDFVARLPCAEAHQYVEEVFEHAHLLLALADARGQAYLARLHHQVEHDAGPAHQGELADALILQAALALSQDILQHLLQRPAAAVAHQRARKYVTHNNASNKHRILFEVGLGLAIANLEHLPLLERVLLARALELYNLRHFIRLTQFKFHQAVAGLASDGIQTLVAAEEIEWLDAVFVVAGVDQAFIAVHQQFIFDLLLALALYVHQVLDLGVFLVLDVLYHRALHLQGLSIFVFHVVHLRLTGLIVVSFQGRLF